MGIDETPEEIKTEIRITSISIAGLKKTRLSTAEQPLRKFIGTRAEEINSADVMAAVLATGILEPVSVEVSGSVLSVTVAEKWSIIPIPVFFASSNGNIGGGLAFLEANAFGLNDKFFATGMYQSNGWLVSAGYVHSSLGGRSPGWTLSASFTREERHDTNQDDDDLRIFDLDTISGTAGINMRFIPDSDLFSAALQVSFTQKNLRKKELASGAPDTSIGLFGSSFEIFFKTNSWDGYFLSQGTASIRYTIKTNFGGTTYHSARLRGAWEKSIVPGFRFCFRTGALFEPEAPVLFESPPGAAQVSILPKNFSARSYAGFSAGLEKYIFRFSKGTLSISAAYQLVLSEGSLLKKSVDHGVEGMLTFYLRQLAIPAVGVGIAYNVREDYLQGSFSLGMSF